MRSKMHLRAVLMLMLVTVIWGSGFIATEYAIASKIDYAWIMALRFLTGALIIAIAFHQKIRLSTRKTILHGCIAGIILFAAFYVQTIGQSRTTVSNAAFITAGNVVMIPFIVWLFTAKRPQLKVFLLSILTMLGVVLLSVSFEEKLQFGTGDAFVLLCAVLFAGHIAYLGLCCKEDEAVSLAFWQLLSAALAGVLVLLLLRPQSTPAQWQAAWMPILYLGIFSTGACYLMQTAAQQHVTASEAGIILSLEGLFGTLFSLLLGLETLRLNMLLGGILITASVMLMEYRSKKESE